VTHSRRRTTFHVGHGRRAFGTPFDIVQAATAETLGVQIHANQQASRHGGNNNDGSIPE
jgi:hypothetical protein